MAEFTGEDLSGSRFEDVSLAEAAFHGVDLSRAHLHGVDLSGADVRGADLSGARFRGVDVVDVQISGYVSHLVVNGVDVAPLLEAELDRRHPQRARMRPTDPTGYREAWAILDGLWRQTVDRARRLPPDLLHARVDGEWSFIETLRHLVFATDAWVRRAYLGDPSPWDPLDLPHDEMGVVPGVPRDPDARPTLDEVLALRADRMATVSGVFAELTDEVLAGSTEPVLEPGYPESQSFTVRRCLDCILSEEWEHRLYAERDLDVLEAGALRARASS